jgi:hypothetical protein
LSSLSLQKTALAQPGKPLCNPRFSGHSLQPHRLQVTSCEPDAPLSSKRALSWWAPAHWTLHEGPDNGELRAPALRTKPGSSVWPLPGTSSGQWSSRVPFWPAALCRVTHIPSHNALGQASQHFHPPKKSNPFHRHATSEFMSPQSRSCHLNLATALNGQHLDPIFRGGNRLKEGSDSPKVPPLIMTIHSH